MAEPVPLEGVYLRSYLRPFATWLERDDVSEILVNRPGEVWIEAAGRPHMQRVEAPEVTDELMGRLAAQIARAGHQAVNRESPLLGPPCPAASACRWWGRRPRAGTGPWRSADT